MPAKRARNDLRQQLGDVFTRVEALNAGLTSYRLYSMRDAGRIVTVGRGVFRWTDAEVAELDLIEIAERVPRATLCLQTALARHALTDAIPPLIDVAIPRGNHRPRLNAPIQLHNFDPRTFEVGRKFIDVGARTPLALYSPERTLIDAIRLGHQQGHEQGWEALRRWLRRPGAAPIKLLKMARHFAGTETKLRAALEILL